MPPDVDEFLPPHVAAGQRELHARKNLSIGRNVGQSVTRTARISFHHIFVRRRRGSAEFLDLPNQALIVKDSVQFRTGDTQIQDRGVTVHFRSDGRVQSVGDAQFAGQGLHSCTVPHVGGHQHIRNYDPQSLLGQEADRLDAPAE